MSSHLQGTKNSASLVQIGEQPVLGMKLLTICSGHGGAVGQLAWDPSGQRIASASADGTTRIWEAGSGKCVATLKIPGTTPTCAAWSPDGAVLATADREGNIVTWRASDFTKLGNFRDTTPRVTYTLFHGGEYPAWQTGAQQVPTPVYLDLLWREPSQVFVGADDGLRLVRFNQDLADFKRVDLPPVHSLALSTDGTEIAIACDDGNAYVFDVEKLSQTYTLKGHDKQVLAIARSPNDALIATGSSDKTIKLWDIASRRLKKTLEGHTDSVTSLQFSGDGSILISKSRDDTVRIWRVDNGIGAPYIIEKSTDLPELAGDARICQKASLLASCGGGNRDIHVWDIDSSSLMASALETDYVRFASAKVVLLGDSNIGKSCLANRLAENGYIEQGTTHGMQLWTVDPALFGPMPVSSTKERREVILWDMGGQEEYCLVHQLFLNDATLAAIVIDPTRGRGAIDAARTWNKRLEKQLGERKVPKVLVGAKVDAHTDLVDREAVAQLCKECGFMAYIETGARVNRGIRELRSVIASGINWESLAATTRPAMFQWVSDEIYRQRDSGSAVLCIDDLEAALRDSAYGDFDQAFVATVTDQLAAKGTVVKTRTRHGRWVLILQLPLVEQYAGSLILAARDNPRRVPALEEHLLGSPELRLPGISQNTRLPRVAEKIVLEAVTELLVERGICFRHEGLLIFPTLLKATEISTARPPSGVAMHFDFSGAIDNSYASLVSRLVIGASFGRLRLWDNRAEFEVASGGACGIRKVSRAGGFARMDIYFEGMVPQDKQLEFISFVKEHLRRHDIEVAENYDLVCCNQECAYRIPTEVVQGRLALAKADVHCPVCDTITLISRGIRRAEIVNDVIEQKTFALVTKVERDIPLIVERVKDRAFSRMDEEYRVDRPIRILQLSDLHFEMQTDVPTKLQWLEDDIRKGDFLASSELDYVVISGDMTHQGLDAGFRQASSFVSHLIDRFQLSAERFIFVPGNHDVQELDNAYRLKKSPTKVELERAVKIKEQNVFLIPDEEFYVTRFKSFSDLFYHPLLQKPYPLDPAKQGIAYTFPESKLQFLSLNSCWEIDQFNPTRASIHSGAVAYLVNQADKQLAEAARRTSIQPEDFLRIAVWHHPVADTSRGLRDTQFLGTLDKNRVRLCLTGDVHEMRRELIMHSHTADMHVIGAGSFSAAGKDLAEGSPRLYNVLEISQSFDSIKVHTRQQPKPNGPWKGWNEWPMPNNNEGGLPYFFIQFS